MYKRYRAQILTVSGRPGLLPPRVGVDCVKAQCMTDFLHYLRGPEVISGNGEADAPRVVCGDAARGQAVGNGVVERLALFN